jgi:hypothetical protein
MVLNTSQIIPKHVLNTSQTLPKALHGSLGNLRFCLGKVPPFLGSIQEVVRKIEKKKKTYSEVLVKQDSPPEESRPFEGWRGIGEG